MIDLVDSRNSRFFRVEIYVRIYNITRLFTAIYNITCLFTDICSKLMGLSLLTTRSGVYIRVPQSNDTPFCDLKCSAN